MIFASIWYEGRIENVVGYAFLSAKPLKPVFTKSEGMPRLASCVDAEIALVLAVPRVPTSAKTLSFRMSSFAFATAVVGMY